jgi:hypothetical protein
MAKVIRRQDDSRPVWFKTRSCSKRIAHDFEACPYHHQYQGVEDSHLLWPELKQSVPWTPERFEAQQRYYAAQRSGDRQADEQATRELARGIKFREIEARGELKSVVCRLTTNHDWTTCRFGHNCLNPKTGLVENDLDEEAIKRRRLRLAKENAERRRSRMTAKLTLADAIDPKHK